MDEVQLREDIEHLIETLGWQHVQRFIEARIEHHKNQLQTCALDDVMKHRHKIEAYNSIFTEINSILEVAEHP